MCQSNRNAPFAASQGIRRFHKTSWSCMSMQVLKYLLVTQIRRSSFLATTPMLARASWAFGSCLDKDGTRELRFERLVPH